jgi:PAS domain S-box-containing protein
MVPSSFLDTFFLKVSPYQGASRLAVLILLLFSGILLIELSNRKNKVASELLESEKRYQYLMNQVTVGTCILQDKGIINPNLKLLEITGYSEKEIEKLQFTDIVHPDDKELVLTWYGMAMDGGKPNTESSFRILTKNNEIKWLQLDVTPIVWHDRPAQLSVLHDVTNRKRKEEKRQQAKKMEAIGLLAGGVAHDLNNILSGIVSYPELLLQMLPPDSPLCSHVETMHDAGLRAAAVVSDLLTVARGVANNRHVVDINVLAEKFLHTPECDLLKERYPNIRLISSFYQGPVAVLCSEIHIQKSIMNLIFNAFEAIKQDSGEVVLTTGWQEFSEEEALALNLKAGPYAILSVADTGPGISDEQKEHIFEPFYTKKRMGRSGTGLGLTVVWNTIVDHGGAIDIKSSGQGTLFNLYLALAQVPITATESIAKPGELAVNKGSDKRILIVDDEEQQREIGTQFLQFLKYSPESVASGEEAIEFLRHEKVDLLLLDMIMEPGINGRETYEQILEIHPEQKALIVSGYADNEEIAKAVKLGVGGLIKKPYTLKQLADAVDTELKRK